MERGAAPDPADRIVVNATVPEDVSPVIALVGTSLTAASSWPAALQARLSECLALPATVEIIARPAATSVWGLEQADAILATGAHIVVIEFAINDADIRIGQTLATSRATHVALIDTLRKGLPDAAIYLMTTNPALGRAEGRRPTLAAYYRAYEELAQADNLGLVDGYRRWLGLKNLPKALPDGLHPTDDATEAMIVPALAPIIAAALGTDQGTCAIP